MSGANSFGSRFVVTSFGESHGPALGVIIDGCPAGITFEEDMLKRELARRKPGQKTPSGQTIVTNRNEGDMPEILSGVFEGKTLGTPIAILTRNQDAKSDDYAKIKNSPRAGHADDVWKNKFGHTDFRGGGRSSGRETVARVMAGGVARMMIKAMAPNISIVGFAEQIGPFKLDPKEIEVVKNQDAVEAYSARFPSEKANEVEKFLLTAKEQGKSYGGLARIQVHGLPPGLGQPVFHKLKADLASAVMSIGATAGFELGEGFASLDQEGSEFHARTKSPYGGLRGGISTGEILDLRVAFKPTSSVLDVAKQGRHDPCIVPRAVPVIEAMVACVLADHLLWQRTDRV
ncbi:MAG: chorismate synthase [Pseudobdellovibrionaceae bacterium]